MRNLLKLLANTLNPDGIAKIKYNPDLAMQYLKWLKYIPEKELEEMKNILNKKVNELTKDEIHKIYIFKKCQNIIPILERYLSDECKNKDILPVYDFINSYPLIDLMESKLTTEEFQMANLRIEQLRKMSDFDLSRMLKEKMTFETYMKLSMIEAFCVNRLYCILRSRLNEKLDNEISAQINSKRKGFLL